MLRLSSPRVRRRLAWTGAGVFAIAGGAVVSVLFWNTADTTETWSGGPAQTFVAPQRNPLTAGERKQIVAVASEFLETAVARERLERAYDLVGPNIRGGLTLKQWRTGEIPVVPYPVDGARWKVDYSFSDEVGLEVLVFPTQGVKLRPQVFLMSLVAVDSGGTRRWLVDAFLPKGGSPDVVTPNVEGREAAAAAFGGSQLGRVSPRVDAKWLLVPVGGIVLTLLAVPLVLVARERRDVRRARAL